ncbi:MAG: DHA2 family efflux MFS transporter permease subunit [Rhodospirillales bacterium]
MSEASIASQFERFGPAYRWLVTFAGIIGAISVVLSATIVNVAVPSVMGAFGVEQGQAQWIATGFIATMVASQLMNAWVVAALGERVAFCGLLSLFTIGSLIAATSPSLEILIAGRILQGFSAGIVMPLVMSVMISVFPENERGFVIGMYGMGVTMAPGFGPFFGGMAIDLFSWRHMFLMPLGLVGIAFLLGLFLMPHRKFSRKLPSFNWSGYGLLIIALVCIMGGIGNGQRWGWGSNATLLAFIIGIASATAFVISQLHVKNPLLDPTLFLNPQFASAVLLAFVFGAGAFATNYAIPVFAQTVQGFTPTAAGAIIVPAGMMLLVLIPLSGKIADNVPNYIPIMAGCLLFAGAMYFISEADVNTAFWTIALLVMVSRGGHGIVNPNMGKAAIGAVPADKINRGVGTYNFMRQMGGAFGVNIIVVIMETRTAFHSEALTATQTAGNPTSREFLGKVENLLNEAGVPEAVQEPGALNYLGKVIYAQAETLGFQDAFMIIGWVFILVLIPAWILSRSRNEYALPRPAKPAAAE